jgi:hypothetical protein
MSVAVFLGPTLTVAEARAHLPDATFLPPAALGDVYAAVERGARGIALVDGRFEGTPAVWHKEVLYALSRGVRVFGAASMGALRAAELHAFGMEGIGKIFEMYRDGVLEDDDEVAVAHAAAEHDYRCLSVALVNIRDGLRLAVERGVLSLPVAGAVVAAARARFYSERAWPRLLAPGAVPALADEQRLALRRLVDEERPDLKRADALRLLRHVAACSPLVPHRPGFRFEVTRPWQHMIEREPAAKVR